MTEPYDDRTITPDDSVDTSRPVPETEPVGPEPAEEHRRAHGLTEKGRVRRTRASGAWVALILVAILVVLMLIFIGQNTQKVEINFLWLDGRFSLGIALLAAAVAGVLMVALPGAVRIIQLRRALRRNEKELRAS